MSIFIGLVIGMLAFFLFGMISLFISEVTNKNKINHDTNSFLISTERDKLKRELEEQKQINTIMYEKQVAELRREYNKKNMALDNKVLKVKNEIENLKIQSKKELQDIENTIEQRKKELFNFEEKYKKNLIEIIKRNCQLLWIEV